MAEVTQRTDCLYVLPDKSWWVATMVEANNTTSEVVVNYRLHHKGSLNPNMVTLAELYHAPVLVIPTDGGAFRSFRIGFVCSTTIVDVSNLLVEEQLLFE